MPPDARTYDLYFATINRDECRKRMSEGVVEPAGA